MDVVPIRAQPDQASAPIRWRRFAGTALLLLLGVLLARFPSFRPAVINPDEPIFALSAREILHGHLPYERLFDNKPVGSSFILALGLGLFGQSVLAVRLIGASFIWASAALVSLLAEIGGLSRRQAFFSGLIYIAFASTIGGFSTLTEILLTPFTVLAVILLYRALTAAGFGKRLMLISAAGLACGIAIAIKIVPLVPGGAVAGAVLVMLIACRRSTIAAAAVLALAFGLFSAVPMLIAAAVFLRAGELPMFLYSSFGFGAAYASIHPGVTMIAQRLATTVDSLWPLLALAPIAIVALVTSWRRRRAPDALPLLATVWLFGELLAASASLHFYPHYFLNALPPLAILSAYAIRALLSWAGVAEGPGGGRAILLLSGIIAFIPVERAQVDLLRDMNANGDQPRKIAGLIERASAGRTPTLFVTNYQLCVLYRLTGAPLPPTRFVIPNFLFTRQATIIRGDPAAEVARVLASRPDFIVTDDADPLPAWARSQLAAALAGYRPIYRAKGVNVYQALPRTA